MRRTIIGGGVVVAVLAGVWWRARTDASPAPAGTEVARAAISAPRGPELPARPEGERLRGAREALVTEPPVNRPATQARIGDAHAHLEDAVKPCRELVTRNGSPDAQIQFGYRLAVADGEASVSDVSLVWSDYKSADLERCLLDKLGAARWSSPDTDWSTTVEDALTAAELE